MSRDIGLPDQDPYYDIWARFAWLEMRYRSDESQFTYPTHSSHHLSHGIDFVRYVSGQHIDTVKALTMYQLTPLNEGLALVSIPTLYVDHEPTAYRVIGTIGRYPPYRESLS